MSTSDPTQRLVAGRYRLRRQLGHGAMGIVWEAMDEVLQRPVAVKEVRLPPGIPQAEADDLRERTLREARAIAVVSHPNVITLHDVAKEGADPFVVMEYLTANSLADLLRAHGPVDVEQAAVLADSVAAGLQAAHDAGITHRDVKPGNVLVVLDGRVKLTDFGIARNVSEHTMTRTGIMLGSPVYMAPEVAGGAPVTPAADLWGLGATLFAAVDGRAPYDPDGEALAIVAMVVDGEVPLPEHDGPLRAVITGLMVKDPAARLTLAQVRDMVRPLLPTGGMVGFAPYLPPEPEPVASAPLAPAAVVEEPSSAPLAGTPGPLPFQPPRARRRRLPVAVVVGLATVLFLVTTGGGFALARLLGGQPLTPPARTVPTSTPVAVPLSELVPRSADAASLAGERGGGFSVPVPTDWVKFVEHRVVKGLPNSTRVHWVSPDGASELTVERYPDFYPDLGLGDFTMAQAGRYPGYRQVSVRPVDAELPAPAEPGMQITYRTVDAGVDDGASDLNRVAFLNLLPSGDDLWALTVTVPIDQEDSGRRTLFDKIAPELRVAD